MQVKNHSNVKNVVNVLHGKMASQDIKTLIKVESTFNAKNVENFLNGKVLFYVIVKLILKYREMFSI